MKTTLLKTMMLFVTWMFVTNLAFSADTGLTADGMALYETHCASCHGVKGEGGVGVPLALPDFQAGVSDHYLMKTIQLGRVGRIMPAFKSFSDAELHAIVKYVRSFATVKALPENTTPIKGNIVHGGKLFARHCASCHGADGMGGKGTGVTLSRSRNQPIIAPALNNPGFLAAASDQMIKHTLMQGREGTPMNSFIKAGLSEADINDIVAYVRHFEKTSADKHKVKNSEAYEQTNLVYESPYDFDKTVANIRKSAIGKNFRIIRMQTLQDGFVDKAMENKKQVILYFCNFQMLNDSLAIDPRVGLFLPCRVTILEHAGKVKVMAINPLRLSQLFNNDELNRACQDMRLLYEEILEEATL